MEEDVENDITDEDTKNLILALLQVRNCSFWEHIPMMYDELLYMYGSLI